MIQMFGKKCTNKNMSFYIWATKHFSWNNHIFFFKKRLKILLSVYNNNCFLLIFRILFAFSQTYVRKQRQIKVQQQMLECSNKSALMCQGREEGSQRRPKWHRWKEVREWCNKKVKRGFINTLLLHLGAFHEENTCRGFSTCFLLWAV